MQEGRIVAVGTHSELLATNEHYRFVISSLEDEEKREEAERRRVGAAAVETEAGANATADGSADDTRTEGDAERDIQITEAVRQGLDDTHPDRDRDDRSNTGMEVNR